MFIKIDKSKKDLLKELLERNGIDYEMHKDLYHALAYEEAKAALDCTIENEDLFISKQDYEESLKELADEIYNSDEDIMQDLSSLSNDLAKEVLTNRKVLIV